jgi:hypothetical protein
LDEFIKACKSELEYDWALMHNEVNYNCVITSKNNPSILTLDDIDEQTDIGLSKYVFNRCCEYWFCKNKEWQYENEYRIIVFSSYKAPIKIDFQNSLKAIVFGERTSDIVKYFMGNYCKENGYKPISIEFNENENKYKKYLL